MRDCALLVVSDDAPSIIKATETCFPRSERQRWRAIRITDFERHQMAAVRQELNQEYEGQNGVNNRTSKAGHRDKLSGSPQT